MAYKTVSFDTLKAGDRFCFGEGDVREEHVKISPRKAAPAGAPYREREWKVKAHALVQVFVPDPTPEEIEAQRLETAARRVESFRYRAEYWIRDADEVMAKFAESLSKDPQYAMEWSDKVFTAAARRAAASVLLAIMDRPAEVDGRPVDEKFRGIEAALKTARREAMRGARWPSRSTSACSNLAKQELTSAYADFLGDSELD